VNANQAKQQQRKPHVVTHFQNPLCRKDQLRDIPAPSKEQAFERAKRENQNGLADSRIRNQ